MPRADLSAARVARWLALPGLVVLAALLAVSLHRTGHTQGDDFALYLRQARSLFDGDVGQVVADNRFSVLNSDSAFSPIAYPWVWPLLLSPFVHLWGFDYDRLKLVEVGLSASGWSCCTASSVAGSGGDRRWRSSRCSPPLLRISCTRISC